MNMPTRRVGDHAVRRFICPLCRSEGIPRTVTIGAGIKTVKVACPVCRHEWDETLPDAESTPHRS